MAQASNIPSPTHGPKAHGTWKWLGFASLLFTLLVGSAAWIGYRSFRPMRIVGPSMAEAFLGKHGELACEKCQFVFRFDLEETPLPDRLICPMCGHVHAGNTSVKVLSGDLVRMTRDKIDRYAVVAFEIPGEQGKLGVKRIIGLPGETVSIQGGDVYIDGKTALPGIQRPWHSPPVHMAHYNPKERWQLEATAAAWSVHWPPQRSWATEVLEQDVEGQIGFSFEQLADANAPLQWVEYQHLTSHDTIGQQPGPILDNDSYNQGLSRALHEVCDLSFSVSAKFAGVLALRMHDGWQTWHIEMDTQRQSVTLFQDGEEVAVGKLPSAEQREQNPSYELSIRDGWLRFDACGSSAVIQHTTGKTSAVRQGVARPVAFGARHGKAIVSPFIVLSRDLYYLDPVGLPQPWTMSRPLGPDEYFVLGDNVPISTDSRHFGPVRRQAIRGVVRKVSK